MANNYTEFSSFMEISSNSIKKAQMIIDKAISEIESNDENVGCKVEIEEDGIWFGCYYGEGNPEHVEIIARKLVEELRVNKPFFCSWAHTCSKPRVDEFGGGAFVIQRGKETFWCDALSTVTEHVKKII